MIRITCVELSKDYTPYFKKEAFDVWCPELEAWLTAPCPYVRRIYYTHLFAEDNDPLAVVLTEEQLKLLTENGCVNARSAVGEYRFTLIVDRKGETKDE